MALIVNPRSELIREPNLLISGRKPIGNVVWKKHQPTDYHLWKRNQSVKGAGIVTYWDREIKTHGRCLHISPVNEGDDYNPYETSDSHYCNAFSGGLTLLAQFVPLNMDGTVGKGIAGRYWGIGGNNRCYIMNRTNTGNTFTCTLSSTGSYNGDYNAQAPDNSLVVGQRHTVLMRFVPSDKVYVYLDGSLVAESTSAPTSIYNPSSSWPFCIGNFWQQDNYTTVFPADHYMHTIWPKPLSDALCRKLTIDPYQFLVPA